MTPSITDNFLYNKNQQGRQFGLPSLLKKAALNENQKTSRSKKMAYILSDDDSRPSVFPDQQLSADGGNSSGL